MKEYLAEMRAGAKAEDKATFTPDAFHSIFYTSCDPNFPLYEDWAYEDVDCRWLRHFLRPGDQFGLNHTLALAWVTGMAGCEEKVVRMENSFEWGGKSNQVNSYDWEDAKFYYKSKEFTHLGYYALGHVLHLLMDASVPEHTHLEVHAENVFGEGY